MAIITSGPDGLDMIKLSIGELVDGTPSTKTSTIYSVDIDTGDRVTFSGTAFRYDANNALIGGTITAIEDVNSNRLVFSLSDISIPAPTFGGWALADNTTGALKAILAGNDTLAGSDASSRLVGLDGDDLLRGGALGDTLDGGTGDNTIQGGAGDDLIEASGAIKVEVRQSPGVYIRSEIPVGNNVLDGDGGNDTIIGGIADDRIRGLDDNDSISGGAGWDDVNGNKGQDIVHGDDGADTVRGGQDDDTVYGDGGDDPHVNGNLGDDVVHGGYGYDTVYGGQGSDTLYGDEGDDRLSGDRGADVMFGGQGADRFTFAKGGGFDWIGDFSPGEGDRIELPAGTQYSITSISGQVVIDLGNGDELGLAGIVAGSFQPGWVLLS